MMKALATRDGVRLAVGRNYDRVTIESDSKEVVTLTIRVDQRLDLFVMRLGRFGELYLT
jgi:LEA14-like dessication related protein